MPGTLESRVGYLRGSGGGSANKTINDMSVPKDNNGMGNGRLALRMVLQDACW